MQNKSSKVNDGESSTAVVGIESESDGFEEVRRVAHKDNLHVKLWRYAMTGALLMTATVVTLATYTFLKTEEHTTFATAYEQFARALADAEVRNQKELVESLQSRTSSISESARIMNSTWPFFSIPRFESHGRDMLLQSGAEQYSIFMKVSNENRQKWVNYATANYKMITEESFPPGEQPDLPSESYHPFISARSPEGFVPDIERDFYYPSWHVYPPKLDYGFINWNVASLPQTSNLFDALHHLKNETLISEVRKFESAPEEDHGGPHSPVLVEDMEEDHGGAHSHVLVKDMQHPHSFVFKPIFEDQYNHSSPIVAICGVVIAWDRSLQNLLPKSVAGLQAVVKNDCNQSYTYEINGNEAIFLGEGDLHGERYDFMEVAVDLALNTHIESSNTPGHCQYSMHIYPTPKFKKSYDSNVPETFAALVATTFLLTTVVFFIYDMFVQRRNDTLAANAAQSAAIVTSMFPRNIRDRLVEQHEEAKQSKKHNRQSYFRSGSLPERKMAAGGTGKSMKPIADLFLDATIMFADICGFTAWSSVREPTQVFILLETVFQSFDHIAKIRGVFKVETVGDCYVAATGLPEPNESHPMIMIKFARLILDRMNTLTKELEITLGPDTGDLSLRIGLHSGPVTAGVLRGERSRFQLFGDTVNTASRIEATGIAGRIHVSQETMDRLVNAGKGHWLDKRPETIPVKGKGDMQTYFVGSGFDRGERGSANSQECSNCLGPVTKNPRLYEHRITQSGLSESALRLVDWNVEMLLILLKQIIARRNAKLQQGIQVKKQKIDPKLGSLRDLSNSSSTISWTSRSDLCTFESAPLDEVQEIIHLPAFDPKVARQQQDPETVEIPPVVESQLREYVTSIASFYRDNAFHNFEHASHVTMSVIKLLSRIVAPTIMENISEEDQAVSLGQDIEITAATLHDHTYGITSDPLTQFACAFSALIHDVDHTGVPNSQLIKEGIRIATVYGNRSVAEQNSLVLAWELLMDERFEQFRSCLCASTTELLRFRRLVVNSVMATDIVDKELKSLRNARWDAAFKREHGEEENPRDVVDRKATIVIEHLIQASDVAHTMQHWHVYRKWNERFFRECYEAYKAGRAENDPSEGWYKGEIGFFDFYIIPLAKKLKNCGVFGKSSDEYLTYAKSNREEWEARGQEMVSEMMESIRKDEHAKKQQLQLQSKRVETERSEQLQ